MENESAASDGVIVRENSLLRSDQLFEERKVNTRTLEVVKAQKRKVIVSGMIHSKRMCILGNTWK